MFVFLVIVTSGVGMFAIVCFFFYYYARCLLPAYEYVRYCNLDVSIFISKQTCLFSVSKCFVRSSIRVYLCFSDRL